ncbi:hypothetical protein POSPLADRAFT_1051890 [Postia placenta MAD-698-R-SB12]|uniref:SAGA-associated factor 11 n=1 Tax=Postia placenta MAD-698-R-SB12 TaxID=670580 RepID=A0A1X6NH58_9APHY|nr:hypothetical protein POSPLADRAFT_1051890 [Postia placenta MAD-698-R-SB12]OSX67766.1 hypothetical protein POSPLADRAFT_1051890 [Postia placenta MAD-698-R-SB12]
MPKKERDEVLSELAARVFADMLEESLMDVVLESHQAVARSRTICQICHTHCGAIHVPGPSGSASQAGPSSRLPTPSEETRGGDTNSPAGAGANTPLNGKNGGNILLECSNCKRQVASNRYAQHLSECLGLGSSRRGATRNATSKSKLVAEAGRSASPYVASEAGNISDDGKPSPAKGKSKSKAKKADDAEFNLHRKRPGSPSTSPAKKSKKAKTSSPIARIKRDPGSPSAHNAQTLAVPSHTRVPSKLRDSSTVPSMHHERSSSPESPSRMSSPAPSISTLASAPSLQSPTLSAKVISKAKPKNAKPPPPPPKRPSPPRPPPAPPVAPIPTPGYLVVDVEGDETGSSTDTDSS